MSFLELEMTDSCNLACSYCYEKDRLKPLDCKKILTYEESKKLILDYRDTLGVEKVSVELFGGEPMLAADTINEILEDDELNKIASFGIVTNSTIFDKKLVYNLIKRNVYTEFSIDPPRTHDAYRKFTTGDKSFNHCMSTFNKYLDVFYKQNYDRFRIRATYHGTCDEMDIYQHILFFKYKNINTFVNIDSACGNQLKYADRLKQIFLDLPLEPVCCNIDCFRCLKTSCVGSLFIDNKSVSSNIRHNTGAFEEGFKIFDLNNTGDRFV